MVSCKASFTTGFGSQIFRSSDSGDYSVCLFSHMFPIIFHFLPVPCPFHRCHTPKDFYVSKVISCDPLEVRSWGAAGDAEATDPIRRVPVDHVFVG